MDGNAWDDVDAIIEHVKAAMPDRVQREAFVMSAAVYEQLKKQTLCLVESPNSFNGIPVLVYRTGEEKVRLIDQCWRDGTKVLLVEETADEAKRERA